MGGEGVLHEALREGLLLAGEDVAEVPDVGPVGEHVGDAEEVAGLGVGVAGHADGEPLAAQVVAAGAAVLDAVDAALGVAERDELAQEFG